MPYTGTQADADLKVVRDAIAAYLASNAANLSAADQNSLLTSITTIDQKRTSLATMGALDALDPTGALFPKVTQATQDAKKALDKLSKTQATIAKAITIAGDVVSLATSFASMDVVGIAGGLDQLATDVAPGPPGNPGANG